MYVVLRSVPSYGNEREKRKKKKKKTAVTRETKCSKPARLLSSEGSTGRRRQGSPGNEAP